MAPSIKTIDGPGRPRPKFPSGQLPQIEQIESADRAALLDWWRKLLGTEVPKSLSQSFLRRFIAFEVQCRENGGLGKTLVAQIARSREVPKRAEARTLKPGGRILREWNGVTHVVEVTDAGCHWNGQTHRSLSAVARAITGTAWSGPRFFGIADAGQASKPPGRTGLAAAGQTAKLPGRASTVKTRQAKAVAKP